MEKPTKTLLAGLEHHQAGRYNKATALYHKVLALQPDNPHALHLLGVVAHQTGDHGTAVDLISRALKIRDDIPDYYSNIGIALRDLGRPAKAEQAHREALRLKPDYPEALNNLAIALYDQRRPEEAEEAALKALALQPEFAEALNSLGIALRDQDRHNEAEAAYREALRIKPDYPEALNNLGLALLIQRHYNEAQHAHREAIRLKPDYAAVYLHLSLYDDPDVLTDKDINSVRQLLEKSGISREDTSYLHFVMGKALDERGDYPNAFTHYRQANALHESNEAFDLNAHATYVDNIIATFDEDFFTRFRGQGSISEAPVFIVGLSRSGKTLVERTLAAHPQVHGAGELMTVPNVIIRKLNSSNTEHPEFPASVETLKTGDVQPLAEQYLARLLRDVNSEVTRVCDTLPLNLFHLGLIAAMFPRARIIHCQRDPMDTCLAIYFKSYRRGNLFAYNLETTCGYYREYVRLMDHWRRVLPLQICEISYEDMVTTSQDSTVRLVEFLGLEWDHRWLDAAGGTDLLHDRWLGQAHRYETFLKPLCNNLIKSPDEIPPPA